MPDAGGSLQISKEYGWLDAAKVKVLEGCYIDLGKVFLNDDTEGPGNNHRPLFLSSTKIQLYKTIESAAF